MPKAQGLRSGDGSAGAPLRGSASTRTNGERWARAQRPAISRGGGAASEETSGKQKFRGEMVRSRRLELPRVAPQRPQRCASTNSATTARGRSRLAGALHVAKGPMAHKADRPVFSMLFADFTGRAGSREPQRRIGRSGRRQGGVRCPIPQFPSPIRFRQGPNRCRRNRGLDKVRPLGLCAPNHWFTGSVSAS